MLLNRFIQLVQFSILKLITLHNRVGLPIDDVSMSVRHLDQMEHVTWISPGPMCGWVGRILYPDSCTSVSSWSKVHLLSIWFVAVPLCRPLLPCPSRWHGSLPRHDLWWLTCQLHCSPLPWRLRSVYQLWKSPLLSCAPWSLPFTGNPGQPADVHSILPQPRVYPCLTVGRQIPYHRGLTRCCWSKG